MMRLYWDTELDTMVKRAASFCPDVMLGTEDADVCFNTERFPVTCRSSEITDKDMNIAIDAWVATGVNLTLQYGALDFYWADTSGVLDDWGWFADIAYARTYKVACVLEDTRFLCLFAPSKTNGQPIYWSGIPCSHCPYNTACQPASDYPYLCSRDDVVVDNTGGGGGAASGSVDADFDDSEFESDDLGVIHSPSLFLIFLAVFVPISIEWAIP